MKVKAPKAPKETAASASATPAASTSTAVENVQKTTEIVTLKRRRPNVARPSEEDTLAEELGEDAELQAAIAASLGK